MVIESSTFIGTRIRLDNRTYKNCFFSNCVLEYAAEGPISLYGCTFDNCQWVFVGAAQNTIDFMRNMYHGMGEFGENMIESTFENIKNAGPLPIGPAEESSKPEENADEEQSGA